MGGHIFGTIYFPRIDVSCAIHLSSSNTSRPMSHALDDLKAKTQRFIRVRFRLEAEGLPVWSARARSGADVEETHREETHREETHREETGRERTDPTAADAGDTDVHHTEPQERNRFVLGVAVGDDIVRYRAATDTWHLASTDAHCRYSVSDVTRLARALAAGEGADALLRLGIALEEEGPPEDDLMAESFDTRFSTGTSSDDTTRSQTPPSADPSRTNGAG